jgi:hypothetical protein
MRDDVGPWHESTYGCPLSLSLALVQLEFKLQQAGHTQLFLNLFHVLPFCSESRSMRPDSDHSDRQLVEKKFSRAASEQKHIETANSNQCLYCQPRDILLARRLICFQR